MKDRRLWLGVVLVLAACGGSGPVLAPGVAHVTFVPTLGASDALAVTMAELRVDRLTVLGDAPPTMQPKQPESTIDLKGDAVALTVEHLLPGFYSGVQLNFHAVMVVGTWRGTPFTVHVEPPRDSRVSLQSPVGQTLADGRDIAFTIHIDAGTWFDENVLDAAMTQGGAILLDDQHNPDLASVLAGTIADSFDLE